MPRIILAHGELGNRGVIPILLSRSSFWNLKNLCIQSCLRECMRLFSSKADMRRLLRKRLCLEVTISPNSSYPKSRHLSTPNILHVLLNVVTNDLLSPTIKTRIQTGERFLETLRSSPRATHQEHVLEGGGTREGWGKAHPELGGGAGKGRVGGGAVRGASISWLRLPP